MLTSQRRRVFLCEWETLLPKLGLRPVTWHTFDISRPGYRCRTTLDTVSSAPIDQRPSHVWYLAYGSNLNPARLGLYLSGGETEPGARNPAPPSADRWMQLPFRLEFGHASQRWSGGGVAFVFPDTAATAWFRAWRLTVEQFEDVFAQENRLSVGTELPWDSLAREGHHLDLTSRWYGRLHVIERGQEPLLTFSSPTSVPPNPPHVDYRATIEAGFEDNPAVDAAAVATYLDAAIA